MNKFYPHIGLKPLIWIAAGQNFEIVRFLIGIKADPNIVYNKDVLLTHCIANFDKEANNYAYTDTFCELLNNWSNSINVNIQGKGLKTPLFFACSRKFESKQHQIDVIGKLCKHNANVNISDHNSNTPLSRAIGKDNLAVVEILLKHGATVNRVVKNGSTPLRIAISAKEINYDMVNLLLINKANPNLSYNNRPNPFHQAIIYYDVILIKKFLNAPIKADVNKQGHKSRTPLHMVLRFMEGSLQKERNLMPFEVANEIVSILIEAKANPYIQDSDGLDIFGVIQEQQEIIQNKQRDFSELERAKDLLCLAAIKKNIEEQIIYRNI